MRTEITITARRAAIVVRILQELLVKGVARTSATYTDDRRTWKGPYSSVASATLMIARELGKEVSRRHERSH